MRKLKEHKADANDDMMSNQIINGCDEFHVHMSLSIQHDVVSLVFFFSALVPMPKNRKKSVNESNNNRLIALSSILG